MNRENNMKEEPGAALPENDVERWILGTYTVWPEYCGGSFEYPGGYENTRSSAKLIAGLLQDDWMGKDHKSGVEMVKYLLVS